MFKNTFVKIKESFYKDGLTMMLIGMICAAMYIIPVCVIDIAVRILLALINVNYDYNIILSVVMSIWLICYIWIIKNPETGKRFDYTCRVEKGKTKSIVRIVLKTRLLDISYQWED